MKMAVISHLLRKKFREIVIHTGQHYDAVMSDVFFKELRIAEPKYNLGISRGLRSSQIRRMVKRLIPILSKIKPELVLVLGDTNSTLAGALAAKKLQIPIAHIEAGLRSYDRSMPEELNRLATDQVASLLFCPTRGAMINLKNEGITKGVYWTGDVMFDALKRFLPRADKRFKLLKHLKAVSGDYYLLTIHRAANTQSAAKLRSILTITDELDKITYFPIHPRTKNVLGKTFRPRKNLVIIPALSYLDMLMLEKNARAIITDSGGVQKEAYLLGIPCFTLRKETEWKETLRGGTNRLVLEKISYLSDIIKESLLKPKRYDRRLFGDGKASLKIAALIEKALYRKESPL